MKSIISVPNFFGEAKKLRSFFEDQYADPHQTHAKRFVWDHWYLPDQYKLHRTPAYHYFPQALYRKFHEALLNYGREVLGCYDVTPPWLSYYTDGDFQNIHGDIPHGPWAFVYSLTPWKGRQFSGGETLVFKENILDFWQSFEQFQGLESDDVVQKITQPFNQLLVFDPRIPHGVNQVKGVHDPREGRLVIHGWFKDPEPYVVGPLSRKAAGQAATELMGLVSELIRHYPVLHGTQTFRLSISPKGQVTSVSLLTDTLRFYEPGVARTYRNEIQKVMKAYKFPRSSGRNTLTLPVIYRF